MAMTRDELLVLIDQAAVEGWTKSDLAGQELTELPEEISKLTQLERLILGKRKRIRMERSNGVALSLRAINSGPS